MRNSDVLRIDGRPIGTGHAPYIIAEMSGNHNGEISRAFEIMAAAKSAGADAVKLQTYTADTITIDHDSADFRIEDGLWAGRKLYELYTEAHTPWEWHEALFAKGRELDLTVFSSPFDATAIDFLESLDAPAYKIASFELIDLPLIRKAAATGKPLIMSTGIANLAEIEAAITTAQSAGAAGVALLHCTSGYPTPVEDSNIRTIPHLRQAFGLATGLSDHTMGIGVAIGAVALGTDIIEKHFTVRRADGGPDAAFSLEPEELANLCEAAGFAWKSLGEVSYERQPSEKTNAKFRRSLYVVEDIREGETFSATNMRSIRPGYGLPPRLYDFLIGKRANRDVKRGTPLSWDLIG